MLLLCMFISSYYTTIYLFIYLFFCKEVYFFECLYFSEHDIQMSLYFSLRKGHQLSMYATGNL